MTTDFTGPDSTLKWIVYKGEKPAALETMEGKTHLDLTWAYIRTNIFRGLGGKENLAKECV